MTLPQDLITQTEAAKLRGVSRQMINSLVRRGILPAYGPDKRVRIADVRAYRVTPGGQPQHRRNKNPGQR